VKNRVLVLMALVATLVASVRPAVAGEAPLDPLWQARPTTGTYYDTASIVGDRVWIAHWKGDVFALDLKTGKKLLQTKVEGDVFRGLIATKDAVYLAAGDAVHRLDPKSGEVLWKNDFKEPISMAPAVEGGQLLVGTSRGHIALLDAKSGKEIWKRKLGFYTERVSLAGDYAFYVTRNNKEAGLYALDRKTGKPKWTVPGDGGTFAIGRGVVYYRDAALSVKDGKPVWTVEMAAKHWTVGKDAVVAVFGGVEVAGLDPETGGDLWVWKAPGEHRTGRIPVREAPAVAGGLVAVAVERGEVVLLDEATGRVVASKVLTKKEYDDNGHFHDTPAIANGVLLVSTTRGKTIAVRFPNAKAAWPTAFGTPAGWAQVFEPDVRKLIAAKPPKLLTGLDPKKGQAELAEAFSVEREDARVEALVAVVKDCPKTVAGYRARKHVAALVDQRYLKLSMRNLPKGPLAWDGPSAEQLVKDLLAAEPIDPDAIDGLYDLDDVDVAEALMSAYFGQRAWACEQVGREKRTDTAKRILVDRATKDPDARVRGIAVEGLGGQSGKTAVDAVRAALADKSALVRRAACSVARAVLGNDAKAALTKLAKSDPDLTVRRLAVEILRR
jgi:outer membrane protein assembly factor BamB